MWIHKLPKRSYTVPSANFSATLIRNSAVLIPDIFMHIFYVVSKFYFIFLLHNLNTNEYLHSLNNFNIRVSTVLQHIS
jgi:hypothetical protein